MKQQLLALFLLLVTVTAKAPPAGQVKVIHESSGKTPIVEGLEITGTTSTSILWGYIVLNYVAAADVYAGYESNLFELQTTTSQTVFSPSLYAEIAASAYIEIEIAS